MNMTSALPSDELLSLTHRTLRRTRSTPCSMPPDRASSLIPFECEILILTSLYLLLSTHGMRKRVVCDETLPPSPSSPRLGTHQSSGKSKLMSMPRQNLLLCTFAICSRKASSRLSTRQSLSHASTHLTRKYPSPAYAHMECNELAERKNRRRAPPKAQLLQTASLSLEMSRFPFFLP